MHYSNAKTLEYLKGKIQNAKILNQVCFNLQDWKADFNGIMESIYKKGWNNIPCIVRSSAVHEDTMQQSNAGHFESVLNIIGQDSLVNAVNKVIHSFHDVENNDLNHEIFIQPMLQNVTLSGVVFTRDPSTNAPYIKINYDDKSSKTDTVTAGISNKIKNFYFHRNCTHVFHDFRDSVIQLCFELENILNNDSLDIEFAFNSDKELYLFQVRPLVIKLSNIFYLKKDDIYHYKIVNHIKDRIHDWMQPHPYVFGEQSIYGVMPDWNPAEIIGLKPNPLALSIYREVITNSVWAYQRDNYGYRNLRSMPLLLNFEGLPYIDIRLSFNSFIPKKLKKEIAVSLVNYYLNQLRDNTHLHDKVEFDIIFSCYTLNTHKRIQILQEYGFSSHDIHAIEQSLLDLTNNIIAGEQSLWRRDLEKISKLEKKYQQIVNSSLDDIGKIYWLIEDCKRYGTLPFSGLARGGFIAVELLKSLVDKEIFTNNDYHSFLGSLTTISKTIASEFKSLSKEDFLKKYGHLRPGTYDILSPFL